MVTNARVVIGRAAIAIGYVTAVVPRVGHRNLSRPIAVLVVGLLAIRAAVHPDLRERYADAPGTSGVLLGVATLVLGAVMLVLARPRHSVWLATAQGQHVRALETKSRRRAERLSHAVAMAMSSRSPPHIAPPGTQRHRASGHRAPLQVLRGADADRHARVRDMRRAFVKLPPALERLIQPPSPASGATHRQQRSASFARPRETHSSHPCSSVRRTWLPSHDFTYSHSFAFAAHPPR